MTRFKLDPDNLEVVSFDVPSQSRRPDVGAEYIEPQYSARNTCPDGNCAPYTQGGQWQNTCDACSFTCWAC